MHILLLSRIVLSRIAGSEEVRGDIYIPDEAGKKKGRRVPLLREKKKNVVVFSSFSCEVDILPCAVIFGAYLL